MSLYKETKQHLREPGDGTVSLDIQAKKRQTYNQMQIYYSPKALEKPHKREFQGDMPDSILRIKLNRRIRRLLYDPNNTWVWNRIDNRRLNRDG